MKINTIIYFIIINNSIICDQTIFIFAGVGEEKKWQMLRTGQKEMRRA